MQEEAELRVRVSGELKGAGDEAAKAVDGMEDGAAKKLKEKVAVLTIVQGLLSGHAAYLAKLSTCLIKPKAPHLMKLLAVALGLTKRCAHTTAQRNVHTAEDADVLLQQRQSFLRLPRGLPASAARLYRLLALYVSPFAGARA
jgi:hypothetical protein